MISIVETKVISELADFLYSFLPGKPHPFANPAISFEGIANDLGIEQFWIGGSKKPAIATLLEKTLIYKRDKFCSLIIQIVQRSIKYRGKSNPITKEEIEKLNDYIMQLGFKIEELWDPKFLNSLPSRNSKEDKIEIVKKEKFKDILPLLLNNLIDLEKLPPQSRGYEFEKFLTTLFNVFDLKARSPFRLSGEQIDGSIELDGNVYLVEAKWQNEPVGYAELLALYGKIQGKATWSRGIFISYSGFSPEGLEAFSKGRPTNLIAFSGQDLYFILEGGIELDKMIRLKTRLAAEEGRVYVPVQELKLCCYK